MPVILLVVSQLVIHANVGTLSGAVGIDNQCPVQRVLNPGQDGVDRNRLPPQKNMPAVFSSCFECGVVRIVNHAVERTGSCD